jgi:hypothetical protein
VTGVLNRRNSFRVACASRAFAVDTSIARSEASRQAANCSLLSRVIVPFGGDDRFLREQPSRGTSNLQVLTTNGQVRRKFKLIRRSDCRTLPSAQGSLSKRDKQRQSDRPGQ